MLGIVCSVFPCTARVYKLDFVPSRRMERVELRFFFPLHCYRQCFTENLRKSEMSQNSGFTELKKTITDELATRGPFPGIVFLVLPHEQNQCASVPCMVV